MIALRTTNGTRLKAALKLTQRALANSSSAGQTKNSHAVTSDEQLVENERLETAQAANMCDIGIRKIFNSEHDMFRSTARKFFKEEVVPYHAEWEKKGEVDRELWLKAGELGLLGVQIPSDVGGVGSDWLSAIISVEEQAYVMCTGPGFSLHTIIAMPYIYNYGTKQQIERYIPRMTSGTCIGAIAMTEPSSGSDLQGIKTTAKKDGSDWILNGSKTFITNGCMADVVIVVAITDTQCKKVAHGISLFLVDSGTPGFTRGRKLNKMGMKAQDTAELFFDNVRLPESALLGNVNSGFYMLMTELSQERILNAVIGIAGAEAMFEETRSYVMLRKAFGKQLSSFQTIQHKLAEMKTEICIGRVFVDNLLKMHAESKVDAVQASMAKYWLTDLQNRVAYQCVQLHGGNGYMMEYPIARAYVDARVQPIYGGSNEIMKEIIARSIVGHSS